MPAHPPPCGCMRLMIASKPPSHDAQLYAGHVALVQPALGSSVDLPSPIGLGCAAGCWSQLRTCVMVVVSLSVKPHLLPSDPIGSHCRRPSHPNLPTLCRLLPPVSLTRPSYECRVHAGLPARPIRPVIRPRFQRRRRWQQRRCTPHRPRNRPPN